MSKVKQVIVIRKDLKMRRGKEISQGCHASNEFLLDILTSKEVILDQDTIQWIKNGITKITVTVDSLEELMSLYEQAKEKGLKSYLIEDEGRTEFGGVPTMTALAIGPNSSEEINLITGNLRLY